MRQPRVFNHGLTAARFHLILAGAALALVPPCAASDNAVEAAAMFALNSNAPRRFHSAAHLSGTPDAGVDETELTEGEQFNFLRNVGLTGRGVISFAGEVKEREHDAIAWHLNSPAIWDRNSEFGGAFGLAYRRARNLFFGRPALLGANVFLDYETHKAGNFLRYSVGGEIRTGALDLYGSYYIPLSDTKEHEGLAYYSAEGFDLEANVGVPGADWLSGVVGYYWWKGEGPLADETGTKFGFRARPNFSWQLKWVYDHPDEGNRSMEATISFFINAGGHSVFDENSRPFGGNFHPRNHFYDMAP